jgi:hypothetical protein
VDGRNGGVYVLAGDEASSEEEEVPLERRPSQRGTCEKSLMGTG